MLVIENGTILRGPHLKPERGNMVIEDGVIKEITSERIPCRDRIDASGLIVAPALVNSHVHLGDTVAMDEGDGRPLDEIVRPPDGIKHRILESSTPDELEGAMGSSVDFMMDHGTSAFVDYREGGIGGVEAIRRATDPSPVKGLILGRTL